MTQILGESRNNSILEKTLNVIGPIKNKFSKPDCKVHIFLQENAINSLWFNGYYEEYEVFNRYRKTKAIFITQCSIWVQYVI